jgi:hypothetical protein
VFQAFSKILVASLAMGAAAVVTEAWLDAYLPEMPWATLRSGIRVCGAIGVGLAVLALAATALHLHEFSAVRTRLVARFQRSSRP